MVLYVCFYILVLSSYIGVFIRMSNYKFIHYTSLYKPGKCSKIKIIRALLIIHKSDAPTQHWLFVHYTNNQSCVQSTC